VGFAGGSPLVGTKYTRFAEDSPNNYTPKNNISTVTSEILPQRIPLAVSNVSDTTVKKMDEHNKEVLQKLEDSDIFHTAEDLENILQRSPQDNEEFEKLWASFTTPEKSQAEDEKEDTSSFVIEGDEDDDASDVASDVPDLEETPTAVAEPQAFISHKSPFSHTEDQFEDKIRKPIKGKPDYIESEFQKLKSFHESMTTATRTIPEDDKEYEDEPEEIEVKPKKSIKVPTKEQPPVEIKKKPMLKLKGAGNVIHNKRVIPKKGGYFIKGKTREESYADLGVKEDALLPTLGFAVYNMPPSQVIKEYNNLMGKK
jgi:hypothetical protein